MNKIIPYLFSFLLTFTLFFGFMSFPVSAGATLEDWDSYNTGVSSGSNAFVSWERSAGDDFIIVDTNEKSIESSPNCLRVNDDDVGGTTGYINITSSPNYAEGLKIYLRMELASFTYDHIQYISFYNSTGVAVIQLYMYNEGGSTSDDGLYYYHVTSGWLKIASFSNPDNADWIYIIRQNNTVHGNGCDYNIKRGAVWDNETSVTAVIEDWTDIAYIKTWSTGQADTGHSGYIDVWFDDITLTESATGGVGYGCTDFSEYSSLGTGFTTGMGTIPLYDEYIEIGSFYSIDATFYGVEILFDWRQYNIDTDVANYYCYFNGNLVGYATCFYPYQDKYILQFTFASPIVVDNDKLVIELYHSVSDSTGAYWHLWVASHPLAYPVQYDKGFYFHNVITQLDGILNGEFVPRAMQWKAYYDTYTSGGENPQYENEVVLLGFENNHPTWNIPFTYTRNTVFFLCFVNQTETPYKLHFYREGVEVGQTQTFPRMLNNFKETIGFTPLNDGNYSVAMKTQGGEDIINHSFFVVNISEDYSIWTSPNPSIGNSDYTVYTYIADGFVYEHYQLGFFQITENTNNIYNAFDTTLLSNTNVFGAFIFSHNNMWVNVHKLRIFGDIGNDVWMPLGSIYIHNIGSIIGKTEYIDVSNNEPFINEDFNIHGYHSYLVSFVRVRLGEIPIYDATGENNFLFEFSIAEVGTYTLTLEVLLNGTWFTIDTEIVYVTEDIPDVPSDFETMFNAVPLWIRGILGAIITLTFVFMPFIMLQYLEKINFKVDIPPVVYAISGGIGVTLSTIIGLFDWVIMFFICVIAGLSLLLSYLWGKRGE